MPWLGRVLLALVGRLVPPAQRAFLLGDLVEEWDRRRARGPVPACRWLAGELAGIVRVRLRNADPADRIGLLQNLGGLIEQGGGTPLEALEAWGALLALDADSGQALERTLALSEQSELTPRAGELLAAAVEAAEARAEIARQKGAAAKTAAEAQAGRGCCW